MPTLHRAAGSRLLLLLGSLQPSVSPAHTCAERLPGEARHSPDLACGMSCLYLRRAAVFCELGLQQLRSVL